MAPSLNLPYDIWCHIAQFISPLELERLMSVNSSLFELAMEQRYRQVSFAYLSERMMRTLVRLKDPAVARRVKVLYIYPHFVKEVMDKHDSSRSSLDNNAPRSSTSPTTPSSSSGSWTKRLDKFAHNMIRDTPKLFSKSTFSHSHSPKRLVIKSPDMLFDVMRDVLSGLTSVTDYHIAWSGLPSIGDSPVRFLQTVFRPNVKRVWFDTSLERLSDLLKGPALEGLSGVEELDLFIRTEDSSASIARETQSSSSGISLSPSSSSTMTSKSSAFSSAGVDINGILARQLGPAINSLKPSLKKLSIRVWHALDLSPLFQTISLPHTLTKLSLDIPMSAPHLGPPLALAAFLNLHSKSLQSLSLRASQLSGQGLTPIDTSIESWLGQTFSHVRLESLRSFEISLSLIPFEAALVCIKQVAGSSAKKFTSLSLTGGHLTFQQVERVLQVVGRGGEERDEDGHTGGLKSLRLGSVALSPQLVDALAEKLSSLVDLTLLVREVVPAEQDMAIFYMSSPTASGRPIQDETQLCRFLDHMSARSYPYWALQNLSFFKSSRSFGGEYEQQCREVFGTCIPRLRAFE